ncbi:hypothetical protein K493DRAFT_360661 [Basidiobolus meristosporus CBS 931.73]|uniref:Shugoshin C-terminal domain-containing protein n=1 Tax=Basidiobolus meristosporus CBS 931.73 TaxID=1314790 RepID=A0A1Y1XFX4_9FUNG|nr:hypothetical protein K493DRAFT_360661 [Basidiobolus meristosporus CBS 931.73]|eukprot:ORX84627.1 hypothetical protein K493DRAFT_360661 [Basidiobolus meristosporus CBS 931.73]
MYLHIANLFIFSPLTTVTLYPIMASFKVAKSKITVFADPIGEEQQTEQTAVKRITRIQTKCQGDNKENIDPFGKSLPNKQAGKQATRSKNLAKTPVNSLRQSDVITGHTPSPLADITEAHDSSYVSPLPLSVAYSVDGIRLRRSERVAKRALKQQQTNESSPLSCKEETKSILYSASKIPGPQKRSSVSDIKTRAHKIRKAQFNSTTDATEEYSRNRKNSQRIAPNRNLRF